jgi:hypothetical protein
MARTTHHADPVSAAVEVITGELQRLRRENASFRIQANKALAQLHLMRAERDDAVSHVDRLLAHHKRSGAAA